ncbi:hypothetical protein [Streptomyces sp. Ru87]|uniref:hypothetical protein n=1 Tax=Streptomyces sp. Ru87 TaxID=2044307 RepID=UPI0027BADFEA|nr:hypothetical protein [Streptomyces sp. Ru87]
MEPDALAHSLHRVPVLNNVLSGHSSGPALAIAITAEWQPSSAASNQAAERLTCAHTTTM